MGRAKEKMIEDEECDYLNDFLKQLLERDELQGALFGIAKVVITKGESSLSDKQKNVLDSFIENYKKHNSCEKCSNGNISNLTDYIEVADNSWNLCPMCEYDREKYISEK